MKIDLKDKCDMPRGTFRVQAKRIDGWYGECISPFNEVGRWHAETHGLREDGSEGPVSISVSFPGESMTIILNRDREKVEKMYQGDIESIQDLITEAANSRPRIRENLRGIEVTHVSESGNPLDEDS